MKSTNQVPLKELQNSKVVDSQRFRAAGLLLIQAAVEGKMGTLQFMLTEEMALILRRENVRNRVQGEPSEKIILDRSVYCEFYWWLCAQIKGVVGYRYRDMMQEELLVF